MNLMSIVRIISGTKWRDLWDGALTCKTTRKIFIAMNIIINWTGLPKDFHMCQILDWLHPPRSDTIAYPTFNTFLKSVSHITPFIWPTTIVL